MVIDNSLSELLAQLGDQMRLLRVRKNIDQQRLAYEAGVALNVIKRLEGGKGATLTSIIKVLRVLGAEGWFRTLAPAVSVSPLQMLKSDTPRRRAYNRKSRGV